MREACFDQIRELSADLPARRRLVIEECVRFISYRQAAAGRCCCRLEALMRDAGGEMELELCLHAFLRECWESIDGLGRLVNCILYDHFADAGLYDPLNMGRQCTFYNVRRALSRSGAAAAHPAVRIMVQRTQAEPDAGYERLSFLYNLSLFAVIPPGSAGGLPGYDDLPLHLRRQVRRQPVGGISMSEGVSGILHWCRDFIEAVCRMLCGDGGEYES